MKGSSAVRKQRYIKALYVYGVVPMLLLLEEYEQKEDYMECAIIRDAIQDRVDNMNKLAHLSNDFDVPRHISEVDLSDTDFEYVNEENFKNNAKHYVRAIKELVNGQMHGK